MRGVLLAFGVGVWWLQQQPRLPSQPAVALGLSIACTVAALLLAQRTAGGPARRVGAARLAGGLAALAAAFAGFHWAGLIAQGRLAQSLPPEWENRRLVVVGVIDDLPLANERGRRFALAVEQVETVGATVPARLSLGWYADPPVQVRPGERWRLVVRLRRPHGSANPHGFDLEAWLLDNGFRATGTVLDAAGNERLDPFVGRPMDAVQRLREHFRDRILAVLAERRYAGVVVALAIGEQRSIPAAQWQLFNRTGIGHLLAISGMHVTLFATLVGGAVLFAWRRVPALVARLPAQRAAALVGALAAGGYVLLAGAQVPAQRTFFMLIAAAVALWLGTPGRASSVLLFALGAVLVVDPAAVRAAGFWLSFGAVAVILAAASGRLGPVGSWRSAARTQGAVSIGLAPLTLLLFQQVSVVSPIANALAIPVVTFVVVPLTLAGLVLPFDWPFRLAHETFSWIAAAMGPLAGLPASVWAQHAPGPGAMALALVGTLATVGPRGLPGRLAIPLWLAPVFFWLPAAPLPGTFELAVLDVGQGLAAVIRTHAHALVYDTGPRFSDQADSGSRIVVPHLRGEGIRRVDVLVLSHDDGDHSGGALSLLDVVPVAQVLASGAGDTEVWRRRAAEGGSPVRCLSGMAWEWDGVRFELLHPAPSIYADGWKGNDRSCVLRVSAPGGSALLPGDIEARAERVLIGSATVAADVIVVPHHGSATSSTSAFVDAVRPAEAVITVGRHNRFRHPRSDVVERWRDAGARVHRSDRDGAVLIRFGPVREVRAWRSEHRRYWRDEPPTLPEQRPAKSRRRKSANPGAPQPATKRPQADCRLRARWGSRSPMVGDPNAGVSDDGRGPSDGRLASGRPDSAGRRNNDRVDRSRSR